MHNNNNEIGNILVFNSTALKHIQINTVLK